MTIGIIGYGSFGQFAHELVKHYAPESSVRVYARTKAEDALFRPLAEVARSDLVLLCVPIHAYEAILNELVPLVGPETIVVDVATVKEHTVGLLRRHAGLKFVALHPMFGPYSYLKQGRSLEGLRLVLTEHTIDGALLRVLRREVAALGLVLLEMTPEEHDRMLADTLFLTHYLAQVVTKGGFKRTDIDTLSFGFLMDAVESVQNDTDLFKDVYRYNRHCAEVVERVGAAVGEVQKLLS